MDVSSFSLKKITAKFIAWGKAEVETSKETRKLPAGTSGFRNQTQSWLWLATECANWPVLSPTVHPLSHWHECRCGVNRFLLQPRGLFFGSACKQATGIFHRSPGIPLKAAQTVPYKAWISAQLLSTGQLLMVPSLSSSSWALFSSPGPFFLGGAHGVETSNCTSFFSYTFLVEAEQECGEPLSQSVIQNITQLRFLFLHYWEIVAFTVRWTPYILDSLLTFHQHLRWASADWPQS